MASGNCFFCGLGTAEFMAGWKLKDGSNAKLCINCGSRYANGTFCQTFHHGAEGWRDCSLCQKPLHCGCAISCHIIELLDFGGVACTGCLLRLERKISAAKVRRNTLAQIDADTHPLVPDKGLPKMTSQEQLEEVAENSSSYATLLFQKKLTPSDTYLGNARLVLPIKEAEAHFPKILAKQACPMTIEDTTATVHRREPEGKLVIGTKKVSAASPEEQSMPKGSYSEEILGSCESSTSDA